MPRYIYQCRKCDTRTIIIREIHDQEEFPTCLVCNKPQVRLYDFGTVTFNGSGFYSTDKHG